MATVKMFSSPRHPTPNRTTVSTPGIGDRAMVVADCMGAFAFVELNGDGTPIGLLTVQKNLRVIKSTHSIDAFGAVPALALAARDLGAPLAIWAVVGALLIGGSGCAVFNAPITAAAVSAVSPERAATASAICVTMRQIGFAFGRSR
jgi:hypothetical protein